MSRIRTGNDTSPLLVYLYQQKNLDVLDPSCQPKRSDYGLPEDKFIFACFNQLYKIDPEVFVTWYMFCIVRSWLTEHLHLLYAFMFYALSLQVQYFEEGSK